MFSSILSLILKQSYCENEAVDFSNFNLCYDNDMLFFQKTLKFIFKFTQTAISGSSIFFNIATIESKVSSAVPII